MLMGTPSAINVAREGMVADGQACGMGQSHCCAKQRDAGRESDALVRQIVAGEFSALMLMDSGTELMAAAYVMCSLLKDHEPSDAVAGVEELLGIG
jgi:hypothetical protein